MIEFIKLLLDEHMWLVLTDQSVIKCNRFYAIKFIKSTESKHKFSFWLINGELIIEHPVMNFL